jgi:threonine aldolase
MVERHCRFAARFAEGLSLAGYEVLNDVVLNQLLVSFGDAVTNKKIIAEIQNDDTCWCGGTEWQGRSAMRVSVSCWATTEEDIDRSWPRSSGLPRTKRSADTPLMNLRFAQQLPNSDPIGL